ncbi:MAG: DUF4173 domain-containing protein [Clostridiales Family XIII bacterium]|jgi:hypothetical protein|nr:DUF4173 domain-containing protein [Clostridiales Family XIII bacterium]
MTDQTMPLRVRPTYGKSDAVLAAFMLVIGFLFWEWGVFGGDGSGAGTFLFFIIAVLSSILYLTHKGLRQNAHSLTALAVVLLGALPFILYDSIAINIFLLFFEFVACLFWIAYSCGTTVSKKLSGFVISDWFNQNFIVSFGNFGGLFGNVLSALRDRKRGKAVLAGVLGVIIAIPVIAGILALLISADNSFADFTKSITDTINLARIGNYIFEFVLGIPVACYIFGAVYGNAHRKHTAHITTENTARLLGRAHALPPASVYTPILLLEIIYMIFFIVMSGYLFSAFGGDLPDSYSYAEYARKGFFELCGVSAINLAVLAFAYLFAKRGAGEYPKTLRILTAILSVMTALLIATAMSKMLLYIGAYGLSQLRVYTFWFMVVLMLVFITLIIWHIRPFNAGRPIVTVAVVLFLALFLANTDGIIAKYNVEQYEHGVLPTVDTQMLAQLSDAALPYLYELKENEEVDPTVRADAETAIKDHADYNRGMFSDETDRFYSWNLQSYIYSGKMFASSCLSTAERLTTPTT